VEAAENTTSIEKLFYLADRTWAGLISWLTTIYNCYTLARLSLLWLHLTVIMALAYIDFPLLSVTYVTRPLQYWDTENLNVASSLGGSNTSFEQVPEFVHDPSQWVGNGQFSAAPGHFVDLGDMNVYDSSTTDSDSYASLSFNPSAWADGYSILTRLDTPSKEQFQPSLAAVQINARCVAAYYNNSILMPEYSIGSEAELTFDFADELFCKQGCNATLEQDSNVCISNSSILTMCPTNTTLSRTSSCFTGRARSCGTISQDTSTQLGAIANIQFAVQNPNGRTAVRTCELSVAYVKPVVSTLIGEYVQATVENPITSSLLAAQGFTPSQLLQLRIAGPMNIFLNGPPPAADNISPVTDGFKWFSCPIRVRKTSVPVLLSPLTCMDRTRGKCQHH
jgi:hypothetical protein